MSIAILGGLDRLRRNYERKGRDLGVDITVFSHRVPDFSKRLRGFQGIVIFTGTVAHPMVEDAVRAARQHNIRIERSHSSSLSGLARCLNQWTVS